MCRDCKKRLHHSLTQNVKTSHGSTGVRCVHVCARECVFTPGVAAMVCTAGDTKNSQNARKEWKGGCFVATPPDGRSRFSDWLVSGGYRVQSGSCHSSEERSKVDVHRSSPVLPSPGGVLPDHTVAACRHF